MKLAVLALAVSSALSGFPVTVVGNLQSRELSVIFKDPLRIEANGVHNIHVKYVAPINGTLSIHYGRCDIAHLTSAHHQIGITLIGHHPLASQHVAWEGQRPERFVWIVPNDAPDGGCLHAFSGKELVGRSAPIAVAKNKFRKRTVLGDIADSEGPWFDGVKYLREKEPDGMFVASTKDKTVGIIGAGMSGLMSAYLLDSVGIHNWKIIEASDRIGGRIRTTYFNGTNPDNYEYQEMGAMRFPVNVTYAGTNDTIPILDSRMVFQLVEALNLMNGNDSSLAIKLVNFINKSANQPSPTPRRPSCSQSAVQDAKHAIAAWVELDRAKLESMAKNIFTAHKQAIEKGIFDFSESGYLLHQLKLDLDITDQAHSIADMEPSWLYDNLYLSATDWVRQRC